MSAAICILGLAWLGNMFVNNYMDVLTHAGASILHSAPWFLSVILYLAAPLMFSHAATTVAFMPVVAKIGLSPMVMLAALVATVAASGRPWVHRGEFAEGVGIDLGCGEFAKTTAQSLRLPQHDDN